MYISDDVMESNMQRFAILGEERDIEPFCIPKKELYEMINKTQIKSSWRKDE